jgi:hypothetical protein
MTNKFKPSDFPTRAEYENHLVELERAQTLAGRILMIMNDAYNFADYGTQIYSAMQDIVHDAVQLGYEAAIGKPHKASDYGVNAALLSGHGDACWFCDYAAHRLGERECMLDECKLGVSEFIE